MVSESELIGRLREFLRSSDLNTTTTATVRRQLEKDFGIDLSDRKAFIREQVDLFLQSEHEQPKEEPEEPEDEEDKKDEAEPESEESEDSNEEMHGNEEGEEEKANRAKNGKDHKRLVVFKLRFVYIKTCVSLYLLWIW